MAIEPESRHRRSTRLQTYDYTAAGAYFVTICTYQRQCTLGVSRLRAPIQQTWLEIPRHFPQSRTDEFVLMLNHIHGITWILKPDEDGDACQPVSVRDREVG